MFLSSKHVNGSRWLIISYTVFAVSEWKKWKYIFLNLNLSNKDIKALYISIISISIKLIKLFKSTNISISNILCIILKRISFGYYTISTILTNKNI